MQEIGNKCRVSIIFPIVMNIQVKQLLLKHVSDGLSCPHASKHVLRDFEGTGIKNIYNLFARINYINTAVFH